MFHLVLLIHAHQPLGNFDHVIEDAYQLSYLPFVKLLEQHPGIGISLHYSGSLLEWIERHHPEYFALLRRLIVAGQVEMIGGGYYEPILAAIPDVDRRAQIEKLSGYLATQFGARPHGMWLAERIWEPRLPETLAAAGIDFTLTDDSHFLSAGLDPSELHGDYLTESNGSAVRVLPGLKSLRYLIPFGMVGETIDFCRRSAEAHPGGMAAMGDDLEKFGVWPETHLHVYTNQWLERFFSAVEAESSWLRAVRASEFLDSHAPMGRIYLPTASYPEMMEWALPSKAGEVFERVRHRVDDLPEKDEIGRFLHGGLWHNFFRKYSEANLLHKRMLFAGRRCTSRDDLLAGQSNDAYWHGVFGGLYAPHLRHAVYSSLIKSDRNRGGEGVITTDFDLDGRPELVLETPSLLAVLDPGDGATVTEIDFKPGAVNVVNSLMRRPEGYHRKLAAHAKTGGGGAVSIHDRVKVKEEGLEQELIYDRYERSCFRALAFPLGRAHADFRRMDLAEDPNLAGGAFSFDRRTLVCEHGALRKTFSVHENALACALRLRGDQRCCFGVEMIFNLMAPEAHDRYFEAPGLHVPLRWAGELAAGESLWIKDEWLRVAIHIAVQPAAQWWIAPIHTVSLSEDGFEKVYQGSMILPWWETPGHFDGEVRVEVTTL